MPHGSSSLTSIAITVIVIALVLALRWRRMGRSRPLKLETLYVLPTIFAAIVAITVIETPPSGIEWAWCAIALLIGAALGWYRGKTVAISVDPATHSLNQTASPAAFIFLVVLVVIRVVLREVVAAEATAWNLKATVIVDAFMFLALGLIAAQRLELFLRGRRALAEAGHRP